MNIDALPRLNISDYLEPLTRDWCVGIIESIFGWTVPEERSLMEFVIFHGLEVILLELGRHHRLKISDFINLKMFRFIVRIFDLYFN